jgi:hypothetical protein
MLMKLSVSSLALRVAAPAEALAQFMYDGPVTSRDQMHGMNDKRFYSW